MYSSLLWRARRLCAEAPTAQNAAAKSAMYVAFLEKIIIFVFINKGKDRLFCINNQ